MNMAEYVTPKWVVINIASQWARHLVVIAVNLFLVGYVVTIVGEKHYGGWTIIVSIISYLTLLDAGMSVALQHYVARFAVKNEKGNMASVFSSAHVVYGVGAILALIGCLAVSWAYPVIFPKVPARAAEECVLALRWVAFAMVIFLLNMPIQGALIGMQRHAFRNLADIVSLLFRASVVVFLFNLYKASIEHLGAAFFVAACIRYVLSYLSLRLIEPVFRFRLSLISKSELSQLWNYGGHSMVWSVSNTLIRGSGPIMATILLSSSAATYLYVSTRLVEAFGGLVIAGGSVFVSVASSAHAVGDKDALLAVFIRGTRLLGLFCFFGVAMLIIFGKVILQFWLGPGYDISYWILVVLSIGMLGPWVSNFGTVILMGMQELNVLTMMTSVRLVVSIALSSVLALLFGIVGLAGGLAAGSLFVVGTVVPYSTCRRLEIPMKNFLKSLVAPFVTAVVVGSVAKGIQMVWPPKHIPVFIAECVVVIALFMFLSFKWGLDPVSKTVVLAKLPIGFHRTKV